MPVIVYKTMTISLFYAQGRRIECDSCGQPFCYIHGDVQTARVIGVPLISGDDRMRRDALKQAVAGLRFTAKVKQAGEAMCPHCQCFQNWMVSAAQNSGMLWFGIPGMVLGGIISAVGIAIAESRELVLPALTVGAVFGLVTGILFGRSQAPGRGPHHDSIDDRSMTDDQFQTYLQTCEANEVEPFLAWWVGVGNKPGDQELPVSVGLEDTTSAPKFPANLSTDAFIAAQGS